MEHTNWLILPQKDRKRVKDQLNMSIDETFKAEPDTFQIYQFKNGY